ncbi:MAG: methionine synthase [Dehalococcoidales bacterium]|nr:methionine synthase [Dehalococcoidales bacterium]
MSNTEFNCLPTIIGSMPHTDPRQACSLVTRYLRDIPAWPQLPRRSFLENMYVQYSQGFPGVVVEGDRIYVDTSQDYQKPLEELYAAYLDNNSDEYPFSPDYAAGFYAFLEQPGLSPPVVKGHVTGPLSWGLTVADDTKRAILYHDILGDAVAKLLKLKAAWQEKELRKISKNTIIFVDEPYMASYGSSVAAGPFSSPGKVAEMIDEVFAGISGLKGIHCCGNTDWSVLLKTSLDILNFDTYNFAESVSLYPDEIKSFLARGGCIAWGIVPNDGESLNKESVASLKDRLEEAMAPFTRNGVRFKDLAAQSLLTPSCTLIPLGEEGAEKALELLTGLSGEMRKRYL